MEKERLDIILVEKGLFPSREKARSAIMAGIVSVDGEREDKPGTKFPRDCVVTVKENPLPYVSRGGLKLEKALKEFSIDLAGRTAIDAGASTGGFTDCMLQNGAAKVTAIDVGYGQLAWQLRQDERVICMERTNIRYLKPGVLEYYADFASIDVSFISVKKILPVIKELLNASGELVCLIKPQFEAGRDKVGKHGVVREAEVHRQVVQDIVGFASGLGFMIRGISFSPIKGPEGNIEYLLYASKTGESLADIDGTIDRIVSESHESL